MGNETEEKEDQELKEMEQQLLEAEAQGKQAEEQTPPSPEPEVSPAPTPITEPEVPVTPQAEDETKADPLKWAEKKGYKTPEDMARELLKKDQEYHDKKRKEKEAQAPTPPQNWQPRPDMGYGYPPPPMYPPQNPNVYRGIAQMYGWAEEDAQRIMPAIFDTAKAVAAQERAYFDQKLSGLERSSKRNNELMNLMQDPAFRNENVQKEIHGVLDSNPDLLQRDDAMTVAFNTALSNMARKQLQQGVTPESTPKNKPPVTAGGGNGSANTNGLQITDAMVASWSEADQLAFFMSNGKKIPKR